MSSLLRPPRLPQISLYRPGTRWHYEGTMRVHLAFILLLPLVMLTLALPLPSAAQVYKWEAPDGTIHYSTTPPRAGARPAQLPKIMRGEVKATGRKLISCEKHGGINCQAGPDSDGSVVCYDGFRDASPRFRFSCSTAKLEVSDISEVSEAGGFTVFVRNSKAVAATEAAVIFRPGEGKREEKLTGPREVEPYGVAEFTFTPRGPRSGLIQLSRPTLAQLDVVCANCS